MQRKQRPESNEEPAVTFEIEEAWPSERRSHLGTVGTAAVTGAGVVAGGGTPADSLDVFDQADESGQAEGSDGGIPTTSFSEIADAALEPEFPTIDFGTPAALDGDSPAGEDLHGATGAVGGGFRLDDRSGEEALAAPDSEIEPVSESLVGYEVDDGDAFIDDADDIDLN